MNTDGGYHSRTMTNVKISKCPFEEDVRMSLFQSVKTYTETQCCPYLIVNWWQLFLIAKLPDQYITGIWITKCFLYYAYFKCIMAS